MLNDQNIFKISLKYKEPDGKCQLRDLHTKLPFNKLFGFCNFCYIE